MPSFFFLNDKNNNMKKKTSLNGTKRKAIESLLVNVDRVELLKELKLRQQELFKRKVLDSFDRDIQRLEEEIEMNKSLANYGWIYVKAWSRDCDMCESTRVYKFQSIKAYYKAYDSFCEWLEGPGSFHPITKDEYDDEMREPTRSRDRIMEAYENGNGTSIYV
jgi:hypothetical protein